MFCRKYNIHIYLKKKIMKNFLVILKKKKINVYRSLIIYCYKL